MSVREKIETAVEAEIHRRFDAEVHSLRPSFQAAAAYDAQIGWYLRLTMRVQDYGGRIRQADLGITRQFLEQGAKAQVGPRPREILDWLAPFNGEQTYDEKLHAAGVTYCAEMAERHFRQVLSNELRCTETEGAGV